MARRTSTIPLTSKSDAPLSFWYMQCGLGAVAFVVHVGDLSEALRRQTKHTRQPSWRGAGLINRFVIGMLVVSGFLVLFGLIVIFVLWLSATLRNTRAVLVQEQEVLWYTLSLGHPVYQMWTLQSSSDGKTALRPERHLSPVRKQEPPVQKMQVPSREEKQEPEIEIFESAC